MKINIGFGTQCLMALISGLILGRFIPLAIINQISIIGEIYLKLLNCIIVPLTFSTIVASFAKLDNLEVMKELGKKTLIWFFITALIASIVGIIIGNLFNFSSINISDIIFKNLQIPLPNLTETILNMVPGNIVIDIYNNRIIPLIIFALLFGISLPVLNDKGKVIKIFFDELSLVMFRITRIIITYSPIAIFSLVLPITNKYGLETFSSIIYFVIAVYLACFVQLLIYGLLILFVGKTNPFQFYKQFWPAMITAFTTSSSMATLPVTIECLADKVQVKKHVASFVASLGSTMKMDGCGAIYPAIVCIFTANILHIKLNMIQYLIMAITTAFATLGTAGVPGTSTIMPTLVLTTIGLPLEGLAIVIGIDKIVDVIRTVVNVTGSGACSVIINKSIKKNDINIG